MKSPHELNLIGDPYRGIPLGDLSPEQATHLLEAVQILHDWVTSRYGASIYEYLRDMENLEAVDDDDEPESDF